MVLKVSAKKLFIGVLIVLLTGCASTNPPKAVEAKGNWEYVITTPTQLKAL